MIVSNFLSEGRSIGVLDFGDLAFLTPMLVRSITHTSAASTIFKVFGMTRSGIEPGTSRVRSECSTTRLSPRFQLVHCRLEGDDELGTTHKKIVISMLCKQANFSN